MSTQPYERQPGEPDKAWFAFIWYRDLGPLRTLERVSGQVRAAKVEGGQLRGKGGELKLNAVRRISTQVEDWSRKWNWVQRVRAWDAEQDRKKREAMLAEVEEMGRRQAQQAMAGAQCLQLPYLALLRKLKDDPATVDQLARLQVPDLMKMVTASSMFLRQLHAAEREARGIQRMLEASLKQEAATPAIGGQTIEAQVVQAQIVGAEFGWVQGRCHCGHKHSEHDQENENPTIVPCTVDGCECQSYRDEDEEPTEDAE